MKNEECGGHGKAEAVQPIHNTAVTGQQVGKVLDARLTLDHGGAKIAELSQDRAAERRDQNDIERRRGKGFEEQPGQHGGRGAEHRAGDGALDGFVRADRRAELVPPEPTPAEVRKGVAERRGEQCDQHDRVQDLVRLHRKAAERDVERDRVEADRKRHQ